MYTQEEQGLCRGPQGTEVRANKTKYPESKYLVSATGFGIIVISRGNIGDNQLAKKTWHSLFLPEAKTDRDDEV